MSFPKGGYWPAWAVVVLVGAAYFVRLTDSPGFSGDEAHILEPAYQFSQTWTMSCPAFGPAHHHNEVWIYQAPLHVALAGLVLRIAPLSLATLRTLSVLLAVACGALLVLLLRNLKASGWATAVGVALLMADPLTVSRAREFRYDFLAMAFFLLSLLIGMRRSIRLAVLSGAAAGLAVSSYAGYLILAPAALGWSVFRRPGAGRRLRWAVVWCVGFAIGVLPFAARAAMHFTAFRDQFIWQAAYLAGPPMTLAEHLGAELGKFLVLYRYAPLFPLIGLASVGLLLARRRQLHGRRRREAIRTLNLACLCFALISATSGHRPWYHLVVLPSLALCGALAFDIIPRIRARAPAVAGLVVASLGTLGVAPRLYAATRAGGMRDPLMFDEELSQLVPTGSRVHGDYTLWFIARRHHWAFTMEAYQNDSVEAIVASAPQYLIENPARPTHVRTSSARMWETIRPLSSDDSRFSHKLPSQLAPHLFVYRYRPAN